MSYFCWKELKHYFHIVQAPFRTFFFLGSSRGPEVAPPTQAACSKCHVSSLPATPQLWFLGISLRRDSDGQRDIFLAHSHPDLWPPHLQQPAYEQGYFRPSRPGLCSQDGECVLIFLNIAELNQALQLITSCGAPDLSLIAPSFFSLRGRAPPTHLLQTTFTELFSL